MEDLPDSQNIPSLAAAVSYGPQNENGTGEARKMAKRVEIKFFFKTEVQSIYNIVLVSGVQQSFFQTYMCIYIHICQVIFQYRLL